MTDREKAINDLNVAKYILCNPQMLTPEMCVKIGQAITSAIDLLKEQEPVTMRPDYFNYICSGCESEIDGEFIDYTGGKIKFCPYCGRTVKWE